MRQIKFRGKRIDNGEWVYGSLIDYRDGDFSITVQHHVPTYVCVIPETVGQFTGLTDKNGVEIYENDILNGEKSISFRNYGSDTWDRNTYVVSGKVVFRHGHFEIVGVCDLSEIPYYHSSGNNHHSEWIEKIDGFEVIGNIHEE